MSDRRFFTPIMLDNPLQLEFDRDTGLAWVTIEAHLFPTASGPLGGKHIQQNLRLALSPQMSQALLDQIPALVMVLQQASKGSATQGYVQ